MTCGGWRRLLALFLALVCTVSAVSAANLLYDHNGDGKTNVWDLMKAPEEDQPAALEEALGGADELHKNAEGKWEIWSSLGVYNMAEHAQDGDTFVLMQDVDMDGALWHPMENFKGKLEGNEHTISNMKITNAVDGDMGFFASIAVDGTVIRLNLAEMNVVVPGDATSIGLVAGSCAGKLDACTAIGFVTDERTVLPADLKLGGLVGSLKDTGAVTTHVENMLHAEGQEEEIPNISAKLAVRATPANQSTYDALMAIVGDTGNGTVDPMALLENLNGIMADPNAIAWVQNGDTYTYPLTLTDLLGAISADGNSVITLQKDLYAENNSAINVPYSSTWDLNGYTVYGIPNARNCLQFAAAGTDNKITTVKNGTVYHYEMGIRVQTGGVVVSNVTMYGKNAPCVGIYDTSADYNDINLIEDSELYNAKWGVFTYNEASSDFSNVNITITRTKLVSYNSASPSQLFVHRSGSTPGTVTLGYDVELYTYGDALTSGSEIAGYSPVKLDGTETVVVDGVSYAGLKRWTTNQSLISTEVIAEVTNGGETVQVTNTNDMAKAVKSHGNTKIKLVKDINNSTQLSLPYTCYVDLNGYSITNSAGNSLRFCAAGSENKIAKVQNGTINHAALGIRVDTGSLDVSNVTFNALTNNSAIAFYDPDPVFRSANKIDNCYIYNPYTYAIRWNDSNTTDTTKPDFSSTGVTISNTTVICPSGNVFGIGTGNKPGIITLGENVELYGKNKAISTSFCYYSGNMAYRTDNVSVTVKGTDTSYTLNHWSTNKRVDTVDVLLIGNSLSTTIPEELYQIAKADGITLNVTDLYHAGCRSWQHLEWYENESEEYEYRVYNDMGFWMHGDIKTSNAAFAYMDWDHVSFQDYFTAYYAQSTDFALQHHEAPTDTYIAYLKDIFPNAKLYYYEHWAFQVGENGLADVEAQNAHYAVIKEVSYYLSEKHDLTLIPCGDAFQLARADERIGDTLCKDDCVHDDGPPGGQYLNGCVFYETMFQRTCIGDTWRASNAPNEEKHQILQQHAHAAVAAVHGADYAK